MKSLSEVSLPASVLVESSIDTMIAVNNENKVIEWNASAEDLFALSRGQAIGNTLMSVIPSLAEDEAFMQAFKAARKGLKSFLGTTPCYVHRKHSEFHVIPLFMEEDVKGVLLLIHDASLRLVKEQQLQKLNAELQSRIRELKAMRRELGQLTDIAAHSLRDPIRTIYTTIESLIRSEAGALSNSGRASFRRMQSSLNRINLLLDDLVNINQLNIGDPARELVDFNRILKDVTTALASKISERKPVIETGEMCELKAHSNQLFLLLQHIITNATRFNESPEPRIYIECVVTALTMENEFGVPEGSYFHLKIFHNGNGFLNADARIVAENQLSSRSVAVNHSAIASLVATTVMEAHGGFFIPRRSDSQIELHCFFPVE